MTLRAERELIGATQADLARRMSVDQAAVSRSERLPLERVRPRTILRYRQALADVEREIQLGQRKLGLAFLETGLAILGEEP